MMRCVVLGCPNDVVRELAHKDNATVVLALCAFHAQTAIKYATDEQVGRLVFPEEDRK